MQLATIDDWRAELAKPAPAEPDDLGQEGFFDPWPLTPFLGCYSSGFDACALRVLENLRLGCFDGEDLACQMFREFLCASDLCGYGTSPRVCFPTPEFREILPDLTARWSAYSEVVWGANWRA